MKKISYLLFALAMVALSGCSAIAGIFKAGVAVGIIVVVVVVVIIIWLISMITRK
jgi:Prokaryotic membrane lipoprotein lipid attachment site